MLAAVGRTLRLLPVPFPGDAVLASALVLVRLYGCGASQASQRISVGSLMSVQRRHCQSSRHAEEVAAIDMPTAVVMAAFVSSVVERPDGWRDAFRNARRPLLALGCATKPDIVSVSCESRC